jgi:hypothetical protein
MMSAALKRSPAPTPTPFPSPERAALAHAIAAAADASARKAALVNAGATADAEVRAARRAVEAATEAIETAKSNAARHLTDVALGTAGEAPLSIRQARAAAIEAADHLEACLAAREALNAERVEGKGWSAENSRLDVEAAAVAVIRAEMAARGVALVAQVARLQRELVARGSALQWLSKAGVFPRSGRSDDNGYGEPAADENIRHTVWRMESTPSQWAIADTLHAAPFAIPTGGQRWAAAFEALKCDASTVLPEDLA